MNRNHLLIAAATAVLLFGLFRLRSVQPRSSPGPTAASSAPSKRPPPTLQRPAAADDDALVRGGKHPKAGAADGPIPELGPPPVDPSLEDAPSDVRSAWPLTKDGFRGAMDEVRPAIEECYGGWLLEHEDLGGRVVLGLVIEEVDGLGLVTQATVEQSETDVAVFESCLTSVMSEMQFDAPADGGTMRVTWPFLFTQD